MTTRPGDLRTPRRRARTLLSPLLLVLCGCSSVDAPPAGAGRRDAGAAEVRPAREGAPESRYQDALAALRAGDMERAGTEVKLALQENPLDGSAHFLLGCLLEHDGEHDQAIVAFQRAVAVDATNADALYNLGTLLLWRGELVPAARTLEGSLSIRPDHVPSHLNVGKAYFLTGLPELSIAAYEEALRLEPESTIALSNLLLLAEAAGNHDAAATYRQRLEAARAGRGAASAPVAGEPGVALPVWPRVASAADSPAGASLPVIDSMDPLDAPDAVADDLRAVLRDLPHVTVERRGSRLTLIGYTGGATERAMLDRILATAPEVLDLTSDDAGDPQRMIEFDAVLFMTTDLDRSDIGFNFLDLIDVNFNLFDSNSSRAGSPLPNAGGLAYQPVQSGWIFSASASYSVNIANAVDERVAVLARPHLTALSGTSAEFLAGGELVFRVAGNISGDIRPYPFGTSLNVTPTLLRTRADDGTPRVHVRVEAGRLSVLTILDQDPDVPTTFSKVSVSSEAVINLDQTLILSGLSQRESHTGVSGVPILRDIPLLKYLFSTASTTVSDVAVIILLTPRDPAFADERNREALNEFVSMRRAFVRAKRGTKEDMERFYERYPRWQQVVPNRFASHFFMLANSEIYRAFSGQELTNEDVDLALLGPEKD